MKAGDAVVTYDCEGVTVGCSICYDLRFPDLFQALAEKGAQVIALPAAFTLQTGKDHWEMLLRARAIETETYVCASAQTGTFTVGNEQRQTYGHSLVADPWGHVVAKASDGVGLVSTRLDMAHVERVRRLIPVAQHKVSIPRGLTFCRAGPQNVGSARDNYALRGNSMRQYGAIGPGPAPARKRRELRSWRMTNWISRRSPTTISSRRCTTTSTTASRKKSRKASRILLGRGWAPYDVLTKALVEGMRIVGVDFRDGILFVPEVLMSANAMKAGMAILRPLLAATGAPKMGKMVIGTVKGDIHDIGKNLVCMMMEGAGFEVFDIGINNGVEKYLEAIEKHQPEILGMSALLTTTMPYMKVVIDTLKEKGMRNDYIVLVGGAPLNESFAQAVGADAYCRDAAVAVETAKALLARRQGSSNRWNASEQE